MSDSYQAIYDAVRSRISGGNIGEVAEAVLRGSFDISRTVEVLKWEFCQLASEHRRPSVLYRPTLSADGTAWMALYGANLQEGVAGFGDTPEQAMQAFDLAWMNDPTPAATPAAKAERMA